MRVMTVAACLCVGWLFGLDALADESQVAPTADRAAFVLRRSACRCRQCYIIETPNFRVHCCVPAAQIREIANHCERLKSRCQQMGLGAAEANWEPRCEVVIHSSVAAYSRTLGPGSERTSGCSTIRLDQGRVTERRIDLRFDANDWQTESLPHELTHVVLADRFPVRRIPAWADEGLAMLAESPEKLQARLHELHGLMRSGRRLGLRELLALEQGPTAEGRAVFYGQSVTFTAMLLERGTPEQLVRFIELGQRDGYDKALRDVYSLESWTDLEANWRNYAVSQRLRTLARHALPLTKRLSESSQSSD